MNKNIINLVSKMDLNKSADEKEIIEVENRIGVKLPIQYKEFMLYSNGAEGELGENSYLVIWPIEEVISLNEEFIGDYNDEEIIDIYNKLFYGSNLELLKNEEYHPSFNVDEKHKCWEIFESGLSILNKYLNDDFSMK